MNAIFDYIENALEFLKFVVTTTYFILGVILNKYLPHHEKHIRQ